MSNEAIIIRVTNKYWGGEEMLFKIKQSTKMSKVFRHYEKANGIKKGSSFYMFGDRRVSETDSAQSLHIEDNSQIDCCLSSTFTEPETFPKSTVAEEPFPLAVASIDVDQSKESKSPETV